MTEEELSEYLQLRKYIGTLDGEVKLIPNVNKC